MAVKESHVSAFCAVRCAERLTSLITGMFKGDDDTYSPETLSRQDVTDTSQAEGGRRDPNPVNFEIDDHERRPRLHDRFVWTEVRMDEKKVKIGHSPSVPPLTEMHWLAALRAI